MTIQTLTTFFMYCTIINWAFLMLSLAMFFFAADFIYVLHSKWFYISREAYNVAIYSFLGLYKIAWLVFNVVPWIALLGMG